MKERPILFSGPMVRAILDGRKTQTRRVVKPQPLWVADPSVPFKTPDADPKGIITCPYGAPGDRLWVREAWGARFSHRDLGFAAHHWNDLRGPLARYRTQENLALYAMKADGQDCGGWVPSIHMPRWASRITLEVVSVRVERLQDISESDAIAEGIQQTPNVGTFRAFGWRDYLGTGSMFSPIGSYRSLWQSINGPGSWAENPFVWVVEFKRLEGGGK